MRRGVLVQELRFRAISPSAGLALLIGIGGAFAQSGNQAAQDQGKAPAANPADATKDNQRKTDEFVEAEQAIMARPETRNASGSAAAW